MNIQSKTSNAKFSTYAYYYVLGEVTTYIRENKTIKVSRDLIRTNKQIEKAKDILRQKLLREPSDYEISIFLGIKEEEIAFIREMCSYTKSLDEVLTENEQLDYYNSVGVYEKNMDTTIMSLHQELECLEAEERQIIYDKYYNGYTQSEISINLGISQAQVSRKENKILEKLKVKL